MWSVLQNPQCRLPAYAHFDMCRKMILSELYSKITVITAKELKLEREEYEFCDFTHHASYDTSTRGKSLVTSLRDVPALMNSNIQQVCELTIFEQDYYSFFVNSLVFLQIEIDPAVRFATYLKYPEMCKFFRQELIALLNEKRFNMGDFADYQRFDEIEHLEGSSNIQCFTSGSASVYVPWTVHSAAAIVNSLKVLSQYFAIYPMSCMEMNHNILLDVSERANVLQDSVSFTLPPVPKIKEIEQKIATFESSLKCPDGVTTILKKLDHYYGLKNIDYVCLKMLGFHHPSFIPVESMNGFGMSLGGFFLPVFPKSSDSGVSILAQFSPKSNEEARKTPPFGRSSEENSSAISSFNSAESSSGLAIVRARKPIRNEFKSFFQYEESEDDIDEANQSFDLKSFEEQSSSSDDGSSDDSSSGGNSSSDSSSGEISFHPPPQRGRIIVPPNFHDDDVQYMARISDYSSTSTRGSTRTQGSSGR